MRLLWTLSVGAGFLAVGCSGAERQKFMGSFYGRLPGEDSQVGRLRLRADNRADFASDDRMMAGTWDWSDGRLSVTFSHVADPRKRWPARSYAGSATRIPGGFTWNGETWRRLASGGLSRPPDVPPPR